MTSADRDALRRQLIAHEGLRLHVYEDSLGIATIGVGRNLKDRGITDAEARYLLDNDINACLDDLAAAFAWFAVLDPVRQRVLVDLCFNLGISRLKGFRKFLAACDAADWATAARELLDSKYAQQVGRRAITLAAMLTRGEA